MVRRVQVVFAFGLAATLGCLDIPPIASLDGSAGSPDVSWVTPSGESSFARATLNVEVQVTGGADAVELYRDTTLLVRWTQPPFTYAWETAGEPEGAYHLTVRVYRGSANLLGPARTVTVDHTRPVLLAKSPASNSAVSRHAMVSMSFSEPMAPETLTATSVRLSTAGATLAATSSLSDEGRTLTLTATQPLPLDVSLTLGFDSAVPPTDLAGNPLLSGSDWSFRAPTWIPLGGALGTSAAFPGATQVALQLDSAGRPYLTWSEKDGSGPSNIFASRWTGSAWESLGGALSATTGATDAERPAVAIGPNDTPYLVWSEATVAGSAGRQAQGRRWSDTQGQWLNLPDFIAIPDNNYRTDLALFVLSNGHLLAYDAFNVGSGFGTGERWTTQSPGFPAWTFTVIITSDPTAHTPSNFRVTPRGNEFLLAYTLGDTTAMPQGRYLVVEDENRNLLGGGPITPRNQWVIKHGVAAAADGTPFVTWSMADTLSIGVASFSVGSWHPLGTEVNTGFISSFDPSIAVLSSGIPVVAFSDASGAARSIHVRRWTGSDWETLGPAVNDVSDASTLASRPRIASDGAGHLIVAWEEQTPSPGAGKIHAARWND